MSLCLSFAIVRKLTSFNSYVAAAPVPAVGLSQMGSIYTPQSTGTEDCIL